MFEEVIDIGSIAGISGLIVGMMYIIGGFIVSVHLSRYGIVRYSILREKSLAVGGNYLFGMFIIYLLSKSIAPYVTRHGIFLNISALIMFVTILVLTVPRYSYKAKMFLEKKYRMNSVIFTLSALTWSLFVTMCGNWRYNCTMDKELLYIFIVAGFYFITLFYAEFVYPYPVYINGSGKDLLFTGFPQEVHLVVDSRLSEQLGGKAVDFSKPVILLDQSDDSYNIVLRNDGLVVTLKKEMVNAVIYNRPLK